MPADNLDLRRRRKEKGLSLDEVATRLYGRDMSEATRPAISRFERGTRADLPHGKTRADYVEAIKALSKKHEAAS